MENIVKVPNERSFDLGLPSTMHLTEIETKSGCTSVSPKNNEKWMLQQ